jgi:hypothetical protein
MARDRAGFEGQNELPATFAATRDDLHRLACYVVAPAGKARTGEIGLRPAPGGFATPPFDDGTSVAVRGAELVIGGRSMPITTLRAAADFAGVELRPDPGVGTDLPSFEPDAPLVVDADATQALAAWYAFGAAALARIARTVGTVSAATLWPEHFDLAVVVELADGVAANVGFSPGDGYSDDPYAYVGPFDRTGLGDDFWNAPFGAVRTRTELAATPDGAAAVDAFVAEGLARLRA